MFAKWAINYLKVFSKLDSALACAESIGEGELAITITLINTSSACDYYLHLDLIVSSQLIIEPGTMINGYDNGIVIDGGSATVSNAVFNISSGFGIKFDSSDSALTLGENVTVSGNATALLDPNCP